MPCAQRIIAFTTQSGQAGPGCNRIAELGSVKSAALELRLSTVIGRFGWKAGQPSIEQQSLHADAVTFYAGSLAVPMRRDMDSPEGQQGAGTFNSLLSRHIRKVLTLSGD